MVEQESHWRVAQVDASGDSIQVHATYSVPPVCCPKCGSARRASRHGALDTSFRDVPFLGRQVVITVSAQRYRCSDCGHAFFQLIEGMDSTRRMTARCAGYIVNQVMARSSLKIVATIIGLDEKSLRNVFNDRGMIFSVGDPPRNDRFVCESCLGVHAKSNHQLAPAKHFGRWRSTDPSQEANVCRECFEYQNDAWRAAIVRRRR